MTEQLPAPNLLANLDRHVEEMPVEGRAPLRRVPDLDKVAVGRPRGLLARVEHDAISGRHDWRAAGAAEVHALVPPEAVGLEDRGVRPDPLRDGEIAEETVAQDYRHGLASLLGERTLCDRVIGREDQGLLG